MFASHRRLPERALPAIKSIFTLFLLTSWVCASAAQAEDVWLSSLDLAQAKANTPPAADGVEGGDAITISGQAFEKGVVMNGNTVMYVKLAGGSEQFTATIGIDDSSPVNTGRGGRRGNRGAQQPPPPPAASFRILGDGKVLYESPVVRRGEAGVPVSIDVKGVDTLVLVVNQQGARGGGRRGRGGVRANWANAKLVVNGARPITVALPSEAPYILTPKPGPQPKINGPLLTGVTPGHPVLYKIPATGTKPITYSVTGLPAGLQLDSATGIVTGTIAQRGRYPVTFHAKNALGETKREFTFVAEGVLSLTPALGWNSWNVYGRQISDQRARETADAFVSTGLIDHGWSYINLDDGWERTNREGDDLNEGPTRAEDGTILTNRKFPDMKALGDYFHGKGLKFGIYTGPGPTTCQGLEASWQHELQDFQTFADWGVDYIKYDWCGYSNVLAEGENNRQLPVLKRPYQVGRTALDQVKRDIIYSLCQYGWGNVWEWGNDPDIRGNSWRTTGDITDTWQSMSTIGFMRDQQGNPIDLSPYAGPGHWNDPDMLVIGKVGWSNNLRDTGLTPNEQYTHITLWTLYSSPMLLGCDMTQIDEFTLSLCNNDEVLAVHQDPLGKTAKRVWTEGYREVWARPLADGSQAVGLFNRDEMPMKVTAKWSDIGIAGSQAIRDLWRQSDLGTANGEFTIEVPRHGAVLIKVTPTARTQP
jgi:alpha-galactosidase